MIDLFGLSKALDSAADMKFKQYKLTCRFIDCLCGGKPLMALYKYTGKKEHLLAAIKATARAGELKDQITYGLF